MVSDTTLAIAVIVAALGLLGVVAMETIISIPQQQVAMAARSSVGQCANTEGSAFHNSSVALCHTVPH